MWIFKDAIKTRRVDAKTFLSISQVCSLWREISLSNGKLWASAIDLEHDHPKRLQELVRRAKTAPLVVHSNIHPFRPAQLFNTFNWKYVFERVHDWGAFSVTSFLSSSQVKLLVDALRQPADKLEVFQLCSTAGPSFISPSEFFVLPDNLFSGRAPCLKKFTIARIYLTPAFNFSLWTQLTELTVDFCHGGLDSKKIPSRQWLEILSGMKKLEFLCLAFTSDKSTYTRQPILKNHSIKVVDDVHLDHLRRLVLATGSDRNIMTDIFSKLVVPHGCITSITLPNHHDDTLRWLVHGLDRRVKGLERAKSSIHFVHLRGPQQFGFRIVLDPTNPTTGNYNFQLRFFNCTIRRYEPKGSMSNMVGILRRYRDFGTTVPGIGLLKNLSTNFSVVKSILSDPSLQDCKL
ncbi:hypothetical protein BDN70DRAFT_900370 [Pholiota conissans]|uniref:F-box domain-containing protein n=1 Tax=Pholiota conissans TaxID=109636 RepID=A0A9P6CU15_9AGAR|nr:hypothetical protein BDN70DRAFT_900370 [Pholiota conissans]